MHRRLFVAIVAVAAAALFAAPTPVLAQQTTSAGEFVASHDFTSAFPFVVGGKTLPAGKYNIEQPTLETLVFQEAKSGAPRVEGPVVTRLAPPATALAAPRLVFDKVGDQYFLSEVWIPGHDGFLLYGAKEKHTHHFLSLHKRARK